MTNASDNDHLWISRCFDLARRGIGTVSPNPPVGAVLVYENRILGEGFHSHFGGSHAEVEAFRNVAEADRYLIPQATLYVSLEPCCVTGKTPPCTDLILHEGVMDVRISTSDPNPQMATRGIELLRSKGLKVMTGILEDEGLDLISSFKTNILQHRPYVILKWAQSKHGYIGKPDEKIWLSHPYTNIWTHKKRSMVDAIMVGARTVLLDDPQLTTRDYEGRSPDRVIYDPNGMLSSKFRVFNNDGSRVFYFSKNDNLKISENHIIKFSLIDEVPHTEQILIALFSYRIGILLIEGGAYVHQLFIDQHAWDEAWVIRTEHLLDNGFKAPELRGRLIDRIRSASDEIQCMARDM